MSEKALVEGDKVQHVDHDARFVKDGVIDSITPSKRVKTNDYWRESKSIQEEMVTYANVKWNDGTTDTLDIESITVPDTELERDFRKAYWANEDRIQDKVSQAASLLQEAVRIAEETGVSFRTHISPVSNAYFPRSREERFPELDSQFVSDVTEAYNEYDSTGWRHSAVC